MPLERKGKKQNKKYLNAEKCGESKIKENMSFAPVNHWLEKIFVNIFLFYFVKCKTNTYSKSNIYKLFILKAINTKQIYQRQYIKYIAKMYISPILRQI